MWHTCWCPQYKLCFYAAAPTEEKCYDGVVCCILGSHLRRIYSFLLDDIIVKRLIKSSLSLVYCKRFYWRSFWLSLLTSRTSEMFCADSILFFLAPTTSMDSVNSVQRWGANSLESSVPSPGQSLVWVTCHTQESHSPHTARGSGGHLDRAVGLRRLNPGQKVLQLRGRKTIVRVADNREIIIKRKLGSKKTLDS